MSRTKLSDLINDFLEYCEIEKGHSRLTIANYDHYLQRFLKFAGDIPARKITQELIRKYRIHLNRLQDEHGRGLSRATQNYHIIALRTLIKYLEKRDIKVGVSVEKIELTPQEERQINFLEGEELQRFLNAPDVRTISGLRDKAILEVLFSTGLRVSELCKLQKEDVNLKTGEFGVKGKGDHVRVVFLSDNAKNWLKRYLGTRNDNYPALFIRHMKKEKLAKAPDEYEAAEEAARSHLTPRTIQRIVKKYATAAGITKKITPHALRHTFATDLLSSGADLRSVQEMLGHSSVTTTQVYTHLTNPQLRKVHEKFHGKKREIEENKNS